MTRYQLNTGAYSMVVPRVIDQFEEQDMDGLPSIKWTQFRGF